MTKTRKRAGAAVVRPSGRLEALTPALGPTPSRTPASAIALPLALLAASCASTPEPATRETSAPLPVRAPYVEILERARGAETEAVLVNLWATWCRPCRDEMPALAALRRTHGPRGLEVALVSVDTGMPETMLARRLAELGVDFPTWQAEETVSELLPLVHPEWRGAIPVSLLYDGRGELHRWWIGSTDHATFEARVEEVLREENAAGE